MKYFLFSIFLILSSSLYLYSCATRSVPTGGPKDTIPPQLINTIPKNKSINFRGKSIVLTFDEYIKTKDINNQLIVTPRLKEENESQYKLNKKMLTIELSEPLDSNTTYTFNFQESVQDITESNPARDLVLAFSTGNYIDSLSIEGTVVELLTNKPMANVVVALYPNGDTLDLFNSKPQYFSRTKKDGTFKLENLKNATYRIYSFNDVNKNLTAQSDAEAYGFIPDSIVLDTSIIDLSIPLIKRNVKEFRVQSARPNGKYFEIKFNKYVEDYDFKNIDPEDDSLISNKGAEPGVVRVYNTIVIDSVQTIITATDTIGQTVTDTLFIKFPATQRKSDPISHKLTPSSNSKVLEDFEAKITFNKPVININYDSLFFYYDSLTIEPILQEDITWNEFRDELTINKKLDKKLLEKESPIETLKDSINISNEDTIQQEIIEEKDIKKIKGKKDGDKTKEKNKFDKKENQVMLFMAKGSFVSIENDTLPEISAFYTFIKLEETGLIKGSIETDKEYYFIQLLNNSNQVIKEIKGEESFVLNHIQPGEYKLRILIDNDGDGTWFPGNILKNIPPEDIYFYPEPVIIRANWERELDPINF